MKSEDKKIRVTAVIKKSEVMLGLYIKPEAYSLPPDPEGLRINNNNK